MKPEIEVFDLAMLYNAIDYVRDGLLKAPLHVQFVLGVKHALPAERDILEFEVAKLRQLMPEATWVAAGIGRFQLDVNRWCLEMGGHCRTGLEDNVRWDKHRLAASNAELVGRVAALCGEYGRPVATPAQARDILGSQGGLKTALYAQSARRYKRLAARRRQRHEPRVDGGRPQPQVVGMARRRETPRRFPR